MEPKIKTESKKLILQKPVKVKTTKLVHYTINLSLAEAIKQMSKQFNIKESAFVELALKTLIQTIAAQKIEQIEVEYKKSN